MTTSKEKEVKVRKIQDKISQNKLLLNETIESNKKIYESLKDFKVDSVTTQKGIDRMYEQNLTIKKLSKATDKLKLELDEL